MRALLFVSIWFGTCGSAQAFGFYAMNWSGTTGHPPTSSLFIVDSDTGAVTTVGDSGLTKVNSMSRNSDGDLIVFADAGKAYSINEDTGTPTLISSFTGTGWTGDVRGFAIDGADKWYAVQGDSLTTNELFALDPTSGSASRVGFMSGYTTVQGLTFGSDGTLWGYNILEGGIVKIDTATAAVTDLSAGTYVHGGQTLFFSGGELFLAGKGSLYEVDMVTGAGTEVYTGLSSQPDIRGAEVVPEPVTAWGLAAGLAAFARGRNRRRP